jgi:HAE1 family hydrophobic/amphiphilic exporter-1
MGTLVNLSEICYIGEYWAPPTIERKSRQRYVKVSVTPYQTSLGELATRIEEEVLPQLNVPQGVVIRLAGDYEDQQDMFADMFLLIVLIIILVYMVMASQFESFMSPFVIMFSVPFAIVGVLIGFAVTGTNLGMMSMVGIIILLGIVVKNGIVLIDYTILLRERGLNVRDASQTAARSRLRPILMTTLTTVLGMLPMAIGTGEGAELWRSLGVTVCWGLTISTLVTLVLIPTLYCSVCVRQEKRKKKQLAKQQ